MQDIKDKPNFTRERFIQAVADLLSRWGMPVTAGRAYGYLVLRSEPVGVDQIAADLGVSRAGIWVALRHLERVGQIQRYGEAGSKRALFAPTDDFAKSLFTYSKFLRKLSTLLGAGATVTADDDAASLLLKRSHFYREVHEAMEISIEDQMTHVAKASTE